MKFVLTETPQIHQLEELDPHITHYAPSGDPWAKSFVLVAYARRSSTAPTYSNDHSEVLASLGRGYEWALDGDRGTTLRGHALDLEGEPDGIYVLTYHWTGSGEDTDFECLEARGLNDEEREYVTENNDFRAVLHSWVAGWADVPCRGCGKNGAEHTGFALECPSVSKHEEKESQ